jgi:hypothetical protein
MMRMPFLRNASATWEKVYILIPEKGLSLYIVITPNVAVEWIASLFHIWEVLVQIVVWTPIILTDVFCFPPYLHSDAGIAPQIRPQPFHF